MRQMASRNVGGAPCGVPGGGPPGSPLAPPSHDSLATRPGPASLACFRSVNPSTAIVNRRLRSSIARSRTDATYRSRNPPPIPMTMASMIASPPAFCKAASKSRTAAYWSSSDGSVPGSNKVRWPPAHSAWNMGWNPRSRATWLALVAAKNATRAAAPHPTMNTAAVGWTSGAGGGVSSTTSAFGSAASGSASGSAPGSAPSAPSVFRPSPSSSAEPGGSSCPEANRSKSYSANLSSVAIGSVSVGIFPPSAPSCVASTAPGGSAVAAVALASVRLRRRSSDTTSASSPTSLRILRCEIPGCPHDDSDA